MENDFLLKDLQSKYQGDMDVALANLKVYQMNPSGIGEHPEIIQAMDMEVEKYCTAKEKYEAVSEILIPSQNDQKTLVE